MLRYIIGFLLAIGLIVLVIVLIIHSFSSGGAPSQSAIDLKNDANTGTVVRYTIDSPVAASQDHNDVIITVDNTDATIKVTQGYEGDVIRTKSYSMNTSAYAVFLRSLDADGFTDGNIDPKKADERGQCALGERYIYEVIGPDGTTKQHLWSTSCGGGTFKGSVSHIDSLFQAQIPDYNDLTSDLNI